MRARREGVERAGLVSRLQRNELIEQLHAAQVVVVGGGIIGLEMATVYAALGVKVGVVELTDGLMPGCDRDLVRPLEKRISTRYETVMLRTRITGIESRAVTMKLTSRSVLPPPAAPP